MIKKATKFIIHVFFYNKDLEFFNLNSILHDNQIQNSLSDPLKYAEVPPTCYSLPNTIQNNFFNYKKTVNNINATDTLKVTFAIKW